MRSLFFLLLFQIQLLNAQTGFIQAYDIYEDKGLSFHNMLLEEDTLVIVGGVQHDVVSQWGLFFCKMDTLGNLLDYKTHYDSLGDTYVFEQGYEMIKTSDQGYALVGQLFFRKNPVLIKLDVNGELEFVQEYPDSTVSSIRHWNIIEFEHGFITTGVKQMPADGKWDAFIMRTDQQGQKVWEVNYGEFDLWDNLRGLRKINENEYLITGSAGIGSSSVPTHYDNWKISKALTVDSTGSILWEWEGQIEYADSSQTSPTHLLQDSDGNWVHEGGYVRVLSDDESAFQGEIVKRDTDFNLIWSSRFGQATSTKNDFIDLVQTPDGGWVAAGQYFTEVPNSNPPIAYLAGWLAKVNAQGDSLWSRQDTVFWHPEEGSTNYLSGIVALPSGSLIACGHINRFMPEPIKSFGWLIKTDQYGCIEPGCNDLSNGVHLASLVDAFEVFPNPVKDVLTIEGSGYFDMAVYDITGTLLVAQKHYYNQAVLNLQHLPTGTYLLKIQQGRAFINKRIVKL